MSVRPSGKTKRSFASEDYYPPTYGNVLTPSQLRGTICTTDFYGKETKVAVLSTREVAWDGGLLVKCQPWVGGKMKGKTVELTVGWLKLSGESWYEFPCAFDDDIPF